MSKEVEKHKLKNERKVMRDLEQVYKEALEDINDKIASLLARQDADMQHVIYQVNYQKQMRRQLEAILARLHSREYKTIKEYLDGCYKEGYLGALYDIQRQGVPLMLPIDERQAIRAIQMETKLSVSLYTALGRDVNKLGRQVAGEVSRGIASGKTYGEISKILSRFTGGSKTTAFNNAMRIVRTEGHRIQVRAAYDVMTEAKAAGADVLKQWDATMDGNTRPIHAELNGAIAELEEPFSYSGGTVDEPGGFGDPAEDCNCRCSLEQRARWALDVDETKMLGDTANMSEEQLKKYSEKLHITTDELRKYSNQIIPVKATGYTDFKRKYNKLYNYDTVD